ncbi:L,D-transpeptidase family protein [Pseudanabaena sp. 'Roaring Creek']|uniref:L,D-transpeptidase family protein n=1 Tax=Pseudanabaena sp. 'Roaring Creek' TaxID=1681830 RepID=UPI0006D7E1D8|nr:L,D-transpeptidase family protein [Pseudanabaena sp. 'Roaring Creek']
MRTRSQNQQSLFSSFVNVAIAINICGFTALYSDTQNSAIWANTSESTISSSDKFNSKQFLFLDLQRHWSRLFVEGLLSKTNLSAAFDTADGISLFQPDRPITRAELANYLELAFANRSASRITTRLDEPATKAETLVAIASQLNLNGNAVKTPQSYLLSMFRDAIEIPNYAIPAIATITQEGLVTNYPDPRILAPNGAITKSELAVLIYQALAYQKKVPLIRSLYTIDPNRRMWDMELMQVTRLDVSISRRTVTAFHGEIALKTYPVAVGRQGWSTPIGNHRVLQTIEYPAWQNPFTGDVIPSKDPENPLGDRWIGFWTDGKDWSGFHGTPNRASVGTAASHGCIRMYNEDIRELFSQVTTNTIVRVSP